MSQVIHPQTFVPVKITYEQFLARTDEDHHVEWVDGEVVPMAPISDEHMDLDGWLVALLRTFATERKLGIVRHEPFQMKTGPDLPGRAPDLLFLSNANRHRLKRLYVHGPADLVVEIISPESRTRDRKDKFREYERGGVREYWLIDPDHKQAEFHLLGADGKYHAATLDHDIFHSQVLPGLWIKTAWLWERPLPSELSILKQWKLI